MTIPQASFKDDKTKQIRYKLASGIPNLNLFGRALSTGTTEVEVSFDFNTYPAKENAVGGKIGIPENFISYFKIIAVAYNATDGTTISSGGLVTEGVVKRMTNGTVVVKGTTATSGNLAYTLLDNTASHEISDELIVSADDTNKTLKVTVKSSAASKDTRWGVRVEMSPIATSDGSNNTSG